MPISISILFWCYSQAMPELLMLCCLLFISFCTEMGQVQSIGLNPSFLCISLQIYYYLTVILVLSSGSNHYIMPCIHYTWQWVLYPIAMLHPSQLLIAVCLIARILLYLLLRAFILLANKLFLLSIVSFLALCTCYSIASFLMSIYSDSSVYFKCMHNDSLYIR